MRKSAKVTREVRYEFGFISPARHPDLVICSSLDEALFFAKRGGKLMTREVETRIGEWVEVFP